MYYHRLARSLKFVVDLRQLLAQLATAEAQLYATEFLAPCVWGGKVRTAIANLVYTFQPEPTDFEGWGIFQAQSDRVATVIDEPLLPQITAYLNLLPLLRLRLAYGLRGQTWLAYPINEADMQQRFGAPRPLPVYLVSEGAAFETILARVEGKICWFEAIDRRAEAQAGDRLQDFLRQEVPPEWVQFSGLTPEMRTTYALAWQQTDTYRRLQQHRTTVRDRRRRPRRRQLPNPPQLRNDETRLHEALRQGGGELRSARDRGDYWQVEWTTADGQQHISAIEKDDLTVMSSGICLSGRDRDFDLQSLVGVMENRVNDEF
jgi:hypothetical protein